MFSIIICTYNPEPKIFQRLLNALLQFDNSSVEYEVIIVDNNSKKKIVDFDEVKSLKKCIRELKVIEEKNPGLTSARIAGIKEAKYDWIIFFDDDNEPEKDYLKEAVKVIGIYPEVGAWGPGKIEVNYQNSNDEWLMTKKELFQQKNESSLRFGSEKMWQEYYPFGTGLIIKKTIADIYFDRVQSKRYTLSDRRGKSLASGGDVQLVLTGIDQGYNVGICPNLKLCHIISDSKSNLKYLIKQQYGTASAYIKAFNQVFEDASIKVRKINNFKILKRLYSLYRINYSKLMKNDFKLLLAQKMGEINAGIYASENTKPILLKCYEKFIDV